MHHQLPEFNPPKRRHRLINRMVAMAGCYEWQADKSILVLRNLLKLRTRVRTRFLAAISAVSSCLAYHAQLSPTKTNDGSRVLFAMPDYVYVSNIASQCNISRYTVYRVLDYLAAIGDLVTHTKFDPVTKEYSPTQIILTESFYIRIGFTYESLKAAVKSVNKDSDNNEQTKNGLMKQIAEDFKLLRPSVRRRLSKSAEGILAKLTPNSENTVKGKTVAIPKNKILEGLVRQFTINKGTSANDYIDGGSRPSACKVDEFVQNPDYINMLNILKEAGIPVALRHKQAVESLKNSK